MINAIAIVVEGEPITTAEIKAVQTQMSISKSEAQNLLIENRLQKSAMRSITVSEDDIDTRIAKIAQKNGLSIKQLQKEIKKQGLTWNKFRDQIRTSVKKQKFFREKIAKTIPVPTRDELKIFYKNNSSQFKMPSSITATKYSASSSKILKNFIKSGSKKGIKAQSVTYKGATLSPQLLSMFAGVNIGSFTPILNNGSSFVTFRLKSIGESIIKPFTQVESSVTTAWRNQQQAKAIQAYFERMKSSASIEIIRK
jgi:parvulin-like peptidyl-prolyl isomerase